MATTATTTRTTQVPIVRHGCRALINASVFVESLITHVLRRRSEAS
jgi:hypothetical protein